MRSGKKKKAINEGGIKDVKTIENAVRVIANKLKLDKSTSSMSYYGELYEGEFEVDGKTLKLRVSTHPAEQEAWRRIVLGNVLKEVKRLS